MVTKKKSCLYSTISIQIGGKMAPLSVFWRLWPCNLVCARTLLAVTVLCDNMMKSTDGCHGNQGVYVPKGSKVCLFLDKCTLS